MKAIDIINDEIPPLMHTDTGEKALNWMEEFKVSHLPVLKDGNFVINYIYCFHLSRI